MDFKQFLQVVSYIILLNVALFTTSVVLHEMGHFLLTGNICSDGRIVLIDSTGFPHTEMTCPGSVDKAFLGLTGLPLVMGFGLLFLLLKRPERNFGLILVGLSLMLSGLDFHLVTGSPLVSPALTLIGTFLIVLGEIRLIDRLANIKY